MGFFAKQKLFYYKKYRIDIWGIIKNIKQVTVNRGFYYRFSLTKKKNTYLWEIGSQRRYIQFLVRDLRFLLKKKQINREQFKEKKKKLKKEKRIWKSWIWLLILIKLLFNKFFKKVVSKKIEKVFKILVHKDRVRQKIYYRRTFVYDPRFTFKKKKTFKSTYEFITKRVVKLFYVMYKERQLKFIVRKAHLKNGIFEQNFFHFIECKLPSFIYRTSFFPTLFESIRFVKGSNVWINKKYKPLLYYTVNLFDLVGFRPLYKSYIHWNYFKRLRRKAIMFMAPKCFFVSFIFFFILLIKNLKKKDIINSFNINYFRFINFIE